MVSLKSPDYFIKQDNFECKTLENCWEIKFTDVNRIRHSIQIDYRALPKESIKDFVLGYARCLAIQFCWIDINNHENIKE